MSQKLTEKFRLTAARWSVLAACGFFRIANFFEGATDQFNKLARRIAPLSMDKESKEKIAYHEAAHAVLCTVLPGNGAVITLNILGDASSGGFIGHKAEKMTDKDKMMNVLAMTLGGLMAEKIKYGEFFAGVLHDLKSATRLARQMVDQFGMSDLGTLTIEAEEEKRIFISVLSFKFGILVSKNTNHNSEKLKEHRERNITALIEEAKKIARDALEEYWPAIEKIVEISEEKQILTGDEVREIIALSAKSPKTTPGLLHEASA